MSDGAPEGVARIWRDLPLRIKAALLIGVPTVLLAAVGLVLLSNTSLRENNAQLWVDHTLAVRGKLGTILNRLLVTESAVRAYVVAPRKDAKPDLAAIRADLDNQIDQLARLVQDNPAQRNQIDYLRALARDKFAALESLLAAPAIGRGEVRRGLTRSEEAMQPLQAMLAELDKEETRLQTIRTSTLTRTRHILLLTAAETLILGFLAGVAAALLFAGQIARRMEDLRSNARAMRSSLPLADADPSRDEIGQVKRELTATSEQLAERTRELRQRESELRAIIDNTTAIIFVKDPDSRFLVTNRALEQTFQLPPGEALGKLPEEFFRPEVAAQIRANDLQVLQSGEPFEFEETIDVAGEKRTYLSIKVPLFDENRLPYAVCGISTDITERKRAVENLQTAHDQLEERVRERTSELQQTNERLSAEGAHHRRTAETLQKTQAQLLRAQRTEVVGTVASGIAREFSNVLTAILGHASFLIPEKDEHREAILQLAERASALSRQLIAFGRSQPNERRTIALGHLIRENEPMLRTVLGQSIRLDSKIDPELAPVRADPSQLQQLLLELVSNARDAMPAGGTVTLTATHARELPNEKQNARPWIQLEIRDTGLGIPEEARRHLFEPFFTTKPLGHGTGLGLASVALIAEQNDGWLDCESREGEGTTFTLYLPAAESPVLAAPLSPLLSRKSSPETVLVVEDDPAVGQIVALLLRSLGYHAINAENGEAAEKIIAQHEGQIDLVLTDLNMPRMNGRELLRRLSQSNPQVRVLITSGSDKIIDEETAQHVAIDFLPKPFNREVLAEKVRRALDGESA